MMLLRLIPFGQETESAVEIDYPMTNNHIRQCHTK